MFEVKLQNGKLIKTFLLRSVMKGAGVPPCLAHHHVSHALVDNGKRKENKLCYL